MSSACRGSMVAKPPVVAWMGQGRVLFRWLCWSCSACLRVFVVVVCVVFVGGLGGIATIGAALRRVAGVSGVYGRKTPRVVARLRGCVRVWWLGFAVVAGGVVSGGMSLVSLWLVFVGGLGGIATIGAALRRVVGVSGVYGCKTPRVLAQSAVHLGDMRVTWGFWGVVDDGLGALVRGEAFSARRRVGYVGPQCVLPG